MNCAGCGYLEIISVPDWFKCKKYGHEGPTQTDLRRKCLKDVNPVKTLPKSIGSIEKRPGIYHVNNIFKGGLRWRQK